MKQLLQSVRSGEANVAEVPTPQVLAGAVLVQTVVSLVSVGTERVALEFAKKNLFQKARSRPDLVRQVVDKVRRDGIVNAVQAVQGQLDRPLAPGYSCAGTVIGVGEDATDFRVGDRVACAGSDYAVHAEVVSVPVHLVAKIPEPVSACKETGSESDRLISFEEATFTTVGSIALHGIHLADVKVGELVAVIGLGLLGQLTMQMLKAAGCTVAGMDIQPNRADLARRLGADAASSSEEEVASVVRRLSSGHGADAVVITADTPSNQPVEVAGRIARDRAVVVAVGAVGLQIPRRTYYEKELDFRVSRSYGPGRYDPEYEEKGHDYPIGHVRWTENRNMQAFLRLLAEDKVDVKPLITHRFPIEDAPRAYDLISGKTAEPFLGVLITYPRELNLSRRIDLRAQTHGRSRAPEQTVSVGLLGAGSFATSTLLPGMKKVSGIDFVAVCSATGLSSRHVGERFGFRYCATDEAEVFSDPSINTVVIATRHHLHARQIIDALQTGKNVFCEKPLCLNEYELAEIVRQYHASRSEKEKATAPPLLMVGYNRRFAPMTQRLKTFVAEGHEPLVVNYRLNAGYIKPAHWTQDPEQGGGRIIGEVCHFVDLLTFLVGAPPLRVYARALPNESRYREDNVVITLEFAGGSLGSITYVANGDKSFPKERLEVFGGSGAAVLEDFRRLELVRHGRKKVNKSLLRQDKGHRGEWEAFVAAVRNGTPSPIAFEGIVATTLTTFRVLDSLRLGATAEVNTDHFITAALSEDQGTGE